MLKIQKILAREVLDSRGFPTVEADVYLENGVVGSAIARPERRGAMAGVRRSQGGKPAARVSRIFLRTMASLVLKDSRSSNADLPCAPSKMRGHTWPPPGSPPQVPTTVEVAFEIASLSWPRRCL